MIDLHTHTDQSDGTLAPVTLVRAALDLGLEALAITDHDTLAGYDDAHPSAEESGLELVCGIELSTRPAAVPDGRRAPSVHLLGYFLHTPPTAGFRDWLRGQQQSRHKRNVDLIAKLRSLGVTIDLPEVQVLGRNLTGRPHFAQVLLKKGYVPTIQAAFDLYLADDAQAAVEREEPTLAEGIRRIAAAGGSPVLAHPVRLPNHDGASLEALLGELIPEGLAGIEAYHSEHNAEQTTCYASLAEKFRLMVTGGSDFHGANKPAILLGSGRGGNLRLPYQILERMKNSANR
jgi:hypothetical protein